MCNKRNLKTNSGMLRLKVSNKVENMSLLMAAVARGHLPRRTPPFFTAYIRGSAMWSTNHIGIPKKDHYQNQTIRQTRTYWLGDDVTRRQLRKNQKK